MNIGFFFNGRVYPPKAGGTVHAYQISSQLIKRGHNVSTIFYDGSDSHLKVYRRSEFFKFLKEIDVLYIRLHGQLDQERYTLLKYLTGTRLPVVWEVNAPLEEGLVSGKSAHDIERLHKKRVRLAKLVNAAVCMSEEMKEYARNRLGIEDCTVVPNGSDPDIFSPEKARDDLYSRHKGCLKVVWAGTTYFKWHGFSFMLEIAEKVYQKDKEIVFILIGKQKDLVIPEEYQKNIIVIDQKQYLDLPPYLASADLGLCFYMEDNTGMKFYRSPLKLFDYMASGLPVLATDIGQIKDIVKNGENGFLIGRNNVDEAVSQILKLKKDENLRKKCGNNARQAVMDYYNWGRAAGQTEAVFKRVVQKQR